MLKEAPEHSLKNSVDLMAALFATVYCRKSKAKIASIAQTVGSMLSLGILNTTGKEAGTNYDPEFAEKKRQYATATENSIKLIFYDSNEKYKQALKACLKKALEDIPKKTPQDTGGSLARHIDRLIYTSNLTFQLWSCLPVEYANPTLEKTDPFLRDFIQKLSLFIGEQVFGDGHLSIDPTAFYWISFLQSLTTMSKLIDKAESQERPELLRALINTSFTLSIVFGVENMKTFTKALQARLCAPVDSRKLQHSIYTKGEPPLPNEAHLFQ